MLRSILNYYIDIISKRGEISTDKAKEYGTHNISSSHPKAIR
jgi:hypothetical protein